MERLVKEKLKRPDEFVSFFGRFSHWIAVNARASLLILGIVILSGVGWGTWQWWSHRLDDEAAEAFRSAVEKIPTSSSWTQDEKAGDKSWQKSADEFAAFSAKYGSTSAGPSALLYRGRALLQLSKYDLALEAYSAAEKELTKPYVYLAQEGRALALMQLKRWKDAEPIWSSLSKAEDNPFREFHMWNLGLAQEASNNSAGAIATYKDFESHYANSAMLEQVRTRLAALQSHS